jgi:uncharacterized SAM-binding protein YcdF (DUF218 family)
MDILRHAIELLVNPFFISIVLLGMCTFFVWRQMNSRLIKIASIAALIILLVISTGWLPEFLSYRMETQYPIVTQIDPTIKWVVVLGGGQFNKPNVPANFSLTSASIKRMIEGARLLKALPTAKIVLSGGNDGIYLSEAELLEQLGVLFDIPQHRMVLDSQSLNTAEQALALEKIVHQDPFYLVTSAIHMPRAMALCRHAGLHPIAAPTDITYYWEGSHWTKTLIPNTYNMAYFSIAMHEILGLIWAKALGEI